MGLRATSVKKYELELGNHSGFNYGAETLRNIICEFCDNFYFGGDYDAASTDVIWEVDRKEFASMIDRIGMMYDDGFMRMMKEHWFVGIRPEDAETYTREYVLDLFKGFLADTPEEYSYVYIAWL